MEKEKVLNEALQIISDNLGDYTANLYKNFYKDKELIIIIDSVSQLIEEVLGERNAEKIIQKLKTNI